MFEVMFTAKMVLLKQTVSFVKLKNVRRKEKKNQR